MTFSDPGKWIQIENGLTDEKVACKYCGQVTFEPNVASCYIYIKEHWVRKAISLCPDCANQFTKENLSFWVLTSLIKREGVLV